MSAEVQKQETALPCFTQEQVNRMGPKRIVAECQLLFGRLGSAMSDRNVNRAFDVREIEKAGMDLCVKASARWHP